MTLLAIAIAIIWLFTGMHFLISYIQDINDEIGDRYYDETKVDGRPHYLIYVWIYSTVILGGPLLHIIMVMDNINRWWQNRRKKKKATLTFEI